MNKLAVAVIALILSSVLHAAEVGPVTAIAVGVCELRVIEEVEEVGAELNIFRLGDIGPLQECNIEIVNSRSAALGAFGGRYFAE